MSWLGVEQVPRHHAVRFSGQAIGHTSTQATGKLQLTKRCKLLRQRYEKEPASLCQMEQPICSSNSRPSSCYNWHLLHVTTLWCISCHAIKVLLVSLSPIDSVSILRRKRLHDLTACHRFLGGLGTHFSSASVFRKYLAHLPF